MREFLDSYDELLENNKNMISAGDFNIDLLKEDSSELSNIVASNCYTILNQINPSSYTRRDKSSSSIIDHFHTDLQKKFYLQIGESGLSDHNFLLLVVVCSGNFRKSESQTKKVVNYQNVGNLLQERLTNTGFDSFLSLQDFLKSSFIQETKVKVTNTSPSPHIKPWSNRELAMTCKLKRKFDKLAKLFPANEYYPLKLRELKTLAKMQVDQSRKLYYSKLYEENAHDARQIWKITKEIMFNTKTNNSKKKQLNSISMET
jgi:hypothetical protein